jgi:hypothetical protein
MSPAATIWSVRRRIVLACAALLLAALALAAVHRPHVASFDVRAGRTASGDRVAISLRDGRVGAVAAGRTQARCASGEQFPSQAVRATRVTRRGASFRATGTQRLPYPDGSTGSVTRIAISGTSAASAISGTIAYAVTLYREGKRVDRCFAGPVRFTAR